MSMRRNSITVNESGNIIMPENVSNIWMSEPELVEDVYKRQETECDGVLLS